MRAALTLVFSHFEVTLEPGVLRTKAWGEPIDVSRHEPAVEVKGWCEKDYNLPQPPADVAMNRGVTFLLSVLMVFNTGPLSSARLLTDQIGIELLRKSYLEILELEDIPKLTPAEIKAIAEQCKKERESENARLKKEENAIKEDLKASRKQLDDLLLPNAPAVSGKNYQHV